MFGIFQRLRDIEKELADTRQSITVIMQRLEELNPTFFKAERAKTLAILSEIVERVEEAAQRQSQRSAASTRWQKERELKEAQMEVLKQSLMMPQPNLFPSPAAAPITPLESRPPSQSELRQPGVR